MTRLARRTLLSAGAGLAAVSLAPLAFAQTLASRTFVLLHGAQHGGWCWSRVRAPLEAAGNRVLTPTFTGLGERAHLLTHEVGLDTHVQDIVNVFDWEELRRATIVAHSYAGMIAAGLTERIADRIERIIFLDALVPRNGESWSDLHPANLREAVTKAVMEHGEGWRMPVANATAFGIKELTDVEWVNRRLTPHPFKTYTDKLALPSNALARTPKLYIDCTDPALASLNGVKARVREAGWPVTQLVSGHDAMVISPRELAQIIVGAA